MMSRRIYPLLAMALSALAGCAVNQTKETNLWRQVIDEGQTAPVAEYATSETLTLRRALELANAHNEQLAVSGEGYVQALVEKDYVFARFLPTIELVPTFMRQEKSAIVAADPAMASVFPEKTSDYKLNGTFDFHPFRDYPLLKGANANIAWRKAGLLDQRAIVMLDVAQTFFQVARSEKQVAVLENSVALQEKRVKDMGVQRRAGVARMVDVAQTDAQLAATRNQLIQARNDARNGRAALAVLIGAETMDAPLDPALGIPEVNQPVEAILEVAGKNRQDLAAARYLVTGATDLVESAWGTYFPSVKLDLTRYLERDTFPTDIDWTRTIEVHIPIFSAGLTHAQVRFAYSQLRQARDSESLVRRQAAKEVRVAFEDLASDARQLEQLEIGQTAAREGLRQADAAYRAGLGTNLERLTAQDQVLKSELDLVSEQFAHNVDYLRLLRATGLLATDPLVKLPVPAAAASVAAAEAKTVAR